jgi:hypothetical protein
MWWRLVIAGLVAAVAIGAPAWAGSVSTTESVLIVSSDGTVITPPAIAAAAAQVSAGRWIVTTEGTWTFGTPANASGDYPLLLNGSPANGGMAALLEVLNGKLYALTKSGEYWLRWKSAWLDAGATAPLQGTVAQKVALAVKLPKIPDNSPAGTVVATATVGMAPAVARFTGPLYSSNPLFTAQGLNVVLARKVTPADDGMPTATITALQ